MGRDQATVAIAYASARVVDGGQVGPIAEDEIPSLAETDAPQPFFRSTIALQCKMQVEIWKAAC